MAPLTLQIAAVVALASLLYVVLFVGRRGRNLPPGPPTLPVIGNLHQLPTEKLFLQFTQWSKTYGGVFSLKLGPATAIVLTDRGLIKQVLDKRSAISSDRPVNMVSQQLITEGDHMLWMNTTPMWKQMRKLIHQDLTETKCNDKWGRLQHAESVQMLNDMMEDSNQWKRHLSRFSNSVILSIVYGIRSATIDAPYVRRIEHLLEIWAHINAFGATPPVDIFPFLKYVPQSAFGNWIDRAQKVHDEMHLLYDGLRELVLQRRQKQGSMGTVLDRLLDQQGKEGLTTHQVTLCAGVATKGGSDTSASVLASFVQAMVTWPEVQRKAQTEIDSVVGEGRVPDFSDYDRLPYIAAMVKEAHRWRPVAPLSVPHALSQDEMVDGYLLPKGSIIFLNVWGVHHDEKRFPNPDVFDPDHFRGQTSLAAEYANIADPEGRDHYGYGNGRRLCPGIHLADRNLFHAISKMLWAFDLKPSTDKTSGNPILPDTSIVTGYREGLTACANYFPVEMVVRSEKRRQTIRAEFDRVGRDVFKEYEELNLVV